MKHEHGIVGPCTKTMTMPAPQGFAGFARKLDFRSPESHREPLFGMAHDFLSSHSISHRQQSLLQALLIGVTDSSLDEPVLPFVDIPLLVYSAIKGDPQPAYPLAVATTLLYLGIDTLDDLADGDHREWWKGFDKSEINLAATTLLSTLPQLAISELEISPSLRLQMFKRLSSGLLIMSAGQQRDIVNAGKKVVSAEEVEQSVREKSGEEVALFAALGALLAEASDRVVEAYESFGRAIGTAGQLASDCHDLFNDSTSRDLSHGTRSLPIALYLEKKTTEERAVLLRLLDPSYQSSIRQDEIRRLLHEAGILRIVSFIVELYCQRGTRALVEAAPLEPARSRLFEMIHQISFYPKGGPS